MEMTSIDSNKRFSRRTFVKGTGALVVGFSLSGATTGEALANAGKAGIAPSWPQPSLTAVDSFLEILSDGRIIGKVGKGTGSMGVTTAIQQLFAEELDVPMSSITMMVGDSYTTPNQTGASGSNGLQTEWTAVRQAAATARQQLLQLASAKLGVPASGLVVHDGVVTGGGSSVTYGQLIGGQKFNLQLSATAPQKDPAGFKVVGTAAQRAEIPHIVNGTLPYITDVRLPGMLHARHVRPPVAGAQLVSVNGPHNLPGLVKVVTKGNYVAVVAKTEWQAIQAAAALKVTWKKPATPVLPNGYGDLYRYMTTSKPAATSVGTNVGDVDKAFAGAAKTLSSTYQSDFQSHASMGGACAVADVRDGGCRLWTGGQKPYGMVNTVSDMLGIPKDNIRSTYLVGPGSYGRNDADDAAVEAAYLSQQVGAPVRVQWMRSEATGWDPKSPAQQTTVEAALDASGKVVGLRWTNYTISGTQVSAGAQKASDTLIGNLMGMPSTEGNEFAFDSNSYGFPNVRKTSYIAPWTQALGTGLRSAHMRDPNGPQTAFASEQFIDELAAAAGQDPVAFRLSYLTAERDKNVVRQVAQAANWQARPGPNPANGPKTVVAKGRGISYQTRSGTVNAVVAEVEVNRKTGHVKVTKFTAGQDSGIVINPGTARGTIEANLMQATGRALHESVRFDQNGVKSVDWETYPIASIEDVPEMNVILVNAKGIGVDGKFVSPSGGGEPSTRPTAGAIANAIFDATGVRVRRQPMTPATVLAALKAAGKAL
jgi:CO/xanthine dehydrogenase Mo-binding subunit